MHAALVQAAVREQFLKLAAIRGLGALAFFVEAFEDLVALAAAVRRSPWSAGASVTPTPIRVRRSGAVIARAADRAIDQLIVEGSAAWL
jgi:hypothetical protein